MKSKWVIQLFKEYWVKEQDNCCLEIYDLEQATQYNTKKEASEFINKTNFVQYSKILRYNDVIEKFLEWKNSGMIRREIPLITSSKYNGEGLDDVIKFHINHVENENTVSYEDYQTWPNFDKFLIHFYDLQSYHNNDYSELYHTFRLKFDKDGCNFNKFKEELEKLIPYVTYVDAGGDLIFPIFDKDLSEFGTRYFYYNPREDKHTLYESSYRQHKGNLKQIFDIIKNHYYYE